MNKLHCIMLVDDNPHDNFFHEREIRKTMPDTTVIITKNTGRDALDYIKLKKGTAIHPDIIFLDINMPGMNGWEFLEEYKLLDHEQQSKAMVIMLTTSENLEEVARALATDSVSDFITKPLTRQRMREINEKYFN
jgi:CheY-like chemotaxis protein